jgi:hypothetical protein
LNAAILADAGFNAVAFDAVGVETVFAFAAAVLLAAGFFNAMQVPPGFALQEA